MRHKWLIAAALAAAALAITGGWYYLHVSRLRAARAELRADYARLMRAALPKFYVMYGRLPRNVSEVTVGNPMFRNPELVDRAAVLERENHPGDLEFLFALEDRAFHDVQPISPTEIEAWDREFRRVQEVVESAGGTEDRLRLVTDLDADPRAWLQHAASLSETGSVPNELLEDYVSAAIELQRLQQGLPLTAEREAERLGVRIGGPRPDPEASLQRAEAEFERAVQAILDSLNRSPNGSSSQRRDLRTTSFERELTPAASATRGAA